MRESVQVKTVLTQPKGKEKNKQKLGEPLTKAQKALRAAQAEVKRERQARIQAEKALTEVQEKLKVTQLKTDQNPQSQTTRVSFVVRLTIDKQGQVDRTEIEQVSSGKKQNFISLDGDLLVAFMKACINPETIPEDSISTKPR